MTAPNFPQEHHLLPTTLFSPSKAAAQRAQAADWASVESWLSARYQGRSIPTFERNEDTLKALQALLAANERADEERDALASVQREALVELKATKEKRDKEQIAINQIIAGLDASGQAALQNLASVAVTADLSMGATTSSHIPLAETLASSLIDFTQTSHELTNHLFTLNHLQSRLEVETNNLRAQLQDLRSPAFQPPSTLGRQTLEWSRNTKQLRGKVQEYTDRLAALKATAVTANGMEIHSASDAEPQDLLRREQRVEAAQAAIVRLEERVRAFEGLPRDTDQARKEVERAEKKVMELRRRRDEMFEAAAGAARA